MQNPIKTEDSIDVCGLEYDVAALGAGEVSSSEINHAAHFLISYRMPEAPVDQA